MVKRILLKTRIKKYIRKNYAPNSENLYHIFINTFVLLIVIICSYPLLYVLSASVMTKQEWAMTEGLFLFAKNPSFVAYRMILSQSAIYKAFVISVLRSSIGAVTSTFLAFCAGYAISRYDFFGRKFLLIFIVITMIYSGGIIPMYIVVEKTHMIDNFLVYIIPGCLGAYGTLVFKQTFETMPKEIYEAASIDGAGDFKIMFQIYLPINMPTVSVLLLFSAVGHWNTWIDAFLYINQNTDITPLQLYLRNVLIDPSYTGIAESELASDAVKMALAVIGIIPIMLVYPFFQKYFVKGVYTGAVKQ